MQRPHACPLEIGQFIADARFHPKRTVRAACLQSRARPKIMGAGIAAGPHCPFALDPAETVSPATGGFEGRRPGPKSRRTKPRKAKPQRTKPRSRFLRGPSAAEATFRFPRGLPDRAEALAVRRWRFRSRSFSSCLGGHLRPKPSVPRPAGSRPKPWFRLASPWAEALGHCRVRSSRAEARSCPTLSKPKLLSGRWQRADRSPTFRRAGPEPEGPVSGLSGSAGPKTLGSDGRSRSMPLSHSLRASPQLPPGGGFVSRPAFRSDPPSARGLTTDLGLGCGWEGDPPLPEDRLGHIREVSRLFPRSKRNPPVDNEDNVHNFAAPRIGRIAARGPRRAPARTACPGRAARIKEAPFGARRSF